MTSQDWQEVEERLNHFYTFVELICDGYKVTLVLVRVTQFKNVIRIYVDGQIKGIWYTEDCEERRRFFRPVSKYAHTQKEKAHLNKISKSLRRKMGPWYDPNKKYTYYLPSWTSFKTLKSHLIKNNSNIELILEDKTNENRQ